MTDRVERAWPFEDTPEGGRNLRGPEDFVDWRGREGTEAVVVRIGNHDAQLVLVDAEGRWNRWVYHSVGECKAIAGELGLTIHEGEYPEELRVRINSFRRTPEEFDSGAYPEQGAVGPLVPYKEARTRKRFLRARGS
jgi:hypothetical protein